MKTVQLKEELKNEHDLKKYKERLSKEYNNLSLSDLLNQIIAKKELLVSSVVKESDLSNYAYQILDGKKENPGRDKIIALLFGMHCNDEEARIILTRAGYPPLDIKTPRDSIILFCLQEGYDLSTTNEMLDDDKYKTIG